MGDLPPPEVYVHEAIGIGTFLWGFVSGAIVMLFAIFIAVLWDKAE